MKLHALHWQVSHPGSMHIYICDAAHTLSHSTFSDHSVHAYKLTLTDHTCLCAWHSSGRPCWLVAAPMAVFYLSVMLLMMMGPAQCAQEDTADIELTGALVGTSEPQHHLRKLLRETTWTCWIRERSVVAQHISCNSLHVHHLGHRLQHCIRQI